MSLEVTISPQELQVKTDKIRALDLPEEDKSLLLASLYMTNHRVEEAVNLLEGLINSGSKNKGIYRILGDIHLCSERHELAQNCYQKVLDLSLDSPTCVEKLAAKAGLAIIESKNKIAVEIEQRHQAIENEFNTLTSDRQESAIQAAIRNLSSVDMQLASFLTAATTNCPVSPCTKALNGQLVKSHPLASCITCITG